MMIITVYFKLTNIYKNVKIEPGSANPILACFIALTAPIITQQKKKNSNHFHFNDKFFTLKNLVFNVIELLGYKSINIQ